MSAGDDRGGLRLIREPAEDLLPAERITVGVAITSRQGAEAVADIVRPEFFYRPAHGVILNAAMRLAEANREVDPVAVLGELTRTQDLRAAGGAGSLHDLFAAAQPGWQHHARRVAADFRRRALASAALSVLGIANGAGYDEDAAFEQARKLVDDATAPAGEGGLRTMRELVTAVLEDVDKGSEPGLSLPWDDLTGAIAGLMPGQVIFVAARPGVGKSIMGSQVAAHAAMKLGVRALLVSMEMRAEEITMRLISAQAKVPLWNLTHRDVTDDDWDRIRRYSGPISDSKLVIDDSSTCSLPHLRSRLRGMARTEAAGLLVVDYLGLLDPPAGAENRQNAVAELSRGLKRIAGEFGIPVVVLAQLNRGPANRPDKRPLASDLKDSGAQEADADVVLLLHREDAYEPESSRAGEIDVIVAKNRQGPMCTVTLAFQGHYGRIKDLAPYTAEDQSLPRWVEEA
jgi:replicative DNA helicase